MNVQIQIVSYFKDRGWLDYAIESIEKFCSGFAGVVLVIPQDELNHFIDVKSNMISIKTYNRTKDKSKWHLHHQIMKCNAELYCPEADFILHTDSDCIFTEPITPNEYFVDGKPVMLVEKYERLGGSNWKTTTDKALGINSVWETMRRHPAVHYRGMYSQFRSAVMAHNRMQFENYVLRCKPDFPWGFSEFNAIGNFIMQRPEWRDKYHIIDLETQQRPKDKLLQFWSHWGLDGTITDAGPNYGKRPRQIIEEILK